MVIVAAAKYQQQHRFSDPRSSRLASLPQPADSINHDVHFSLVGTVEAARLLIDLFHADSWSREPIIAQAEAQWNSAAGREGTVFRHLHFCPGAASILFYFWMVNYHKVSKLR